MMSTINKSKNESGFRLKLPEQHWSCTSHLVNLDYCIEGLKNTINNHPNLDYVIGFYLWRGQGTRQKYHEIIPTHLIPTKQNYRTLTLDELLEKRRNVDQGMYEIENNKILGFSEEYRRKMGWLK